MKAEIIKLRDFMRPPDMDPIIRRGTPAEVIPLPVIYALGPNGARVPLRVPTDHKRKPRKPRKAKP